MTLWDLKQGQHARITGIAAEMEEVFQRRLEDLGFRAGETVMCSKKIPFGGPRVFRVGDSVFSVERSMALAVNIRIEDGGKS